MDKRNQPYDNDEIREILTLTIHGLLPAETQYRLLATIAEVPMLRELASRSVKALNAVNLLAQDRELWVLHGPRMVNKIRLAAEKGLLGT